MILNALALKLKRDARGDLRRRHFQAAVNRAIDKHSEAFDILLTASRDLGAPKRFGRKVLQDKPHLAPDRIGTDDAGPYPPSIADSRGQGMLPRAPTRYVIKHLQHGIPSLLSWAPKTSQQPADVLAGFVVSRMRAS